MGGLENQNPHDCGLWFSKRKKWLGRPPFPLFRYRLRMRLHRFTPPSFGDDPRIGLPKPISIWSRSSLISQQLFELPKKHVGNSFFGKRSYSSEISCHRLLKRRVPKNVCIFIHTFVIGLLLWESYAIITLGTCMRQVVKWIDC